jgi:hypothetical protein
MSDVLDKYYADLEGNVAAQVERNENLKKALAKSLSTPAQMVTKDIQAGMYPTASGNPGNLSPYDLDAPAKYLVPRNTPLRNDIPRLKGQGRALEYRRIRGLSNARVNQVPDLASFTDLESVTNTLAGLSRRVGPTVSYQMDTHLVAYTEASLSDSVSFKAQFSDLGFEDVREMSAFSLLLSHMNSEEYQILQGRGQSAQGFSGNFTGTPTAPTVTAVSATAPAGTPLPTGSVVVSVTARAGAGETAAVAASSVTVTTGDNAVQVVVTSGDIPAGAMGLNVYATVSSETYFLGFVAVAGTYIWATVGENVGAAAPSVNTTASYGYDGILTVQGNAANGGYVSTAGYTVASTGDQFIQDACAGLWGTVFGDPDEAWLNAVQSRALGTFLRSTSASSANGAYRINFSDDGKGTLGTVVTGVYNESSPTRKMLDVRVHPFMPVGTALVRSRTLPDSYTRSEVGSTHEIHAVQDYMYQEWAKFQFSYDASTYCLSLNLS